ncbi:MAG: stage III sporulation protein AG [Suilimivivens sp.]
MEKIQEEIKKKLKKKLTKDNFLIILLMGILLLVIAWPVEEKSESKSQSSQWDNKEYIMNLQSAPLSDVSTETTGGDTWMRAYASYLERSLEELLCTMEGVGEVRVMVTLESSGEAVVEKDKSTVRGGSTEVDSAGGSRNTTDISDEEATVYQKIQTGDSPYVKKVLAPPVKGVVVCAQGGGNAKIMKNITEAIQALFGIEAHKIKIVKMISQ